MDSSTSSAKKKLSKFSHNTSLTSVNLPSHNGSKNSIRTLKSITTQTDESSTYFSQNKSNGSFNNPQIDSDSASNGGNRFSRTNLMNNGLNYQAQNLWGRNHECLSLCPTCSHTLAGYNAQMCQPFGMPWYPTPYGFNGNYMPMGLPQPQVPQPQMQTPPPFMSMPILQSVMPYGLAPTYAPARNCAHTEGVRVVNATRTNQTMGSPIPGHSHTIHEHTRTPPSTIGDNANTASNVNCLNPNYIQLTLKHKPKTSSIRSVPNVTKYELGKNCEETIVESHVKQREKHSLPYATSSNINNMHLDGLNHKGATAKSLPKSDTWIPTSDKYRSKQDTDIINNNCNRDIEQAMKTSYYVNKFDRYGMKGDFSSHLSSTSTNTNKDIIRSPIYRYADLRIHELSSNLKEIKEDIVKLSSKASELDIKDTVAEVDNSTNFNKYFKRVYNELKDKDTPNVSKVAEAGVGTGNNLNSNNSSQRNSISNLNSNYTSSLSSLYKNNSLNVSNEDFVNVSNTGLFYTNSEQIQSPCSLSNANSVIQENNTSDISNTGTYNIQIELNNANFLQKTDQLKEIYNNNLTNNNNSDDGESSNQIISQDKVNGQINIMKRTRPLHDIASALNNNQLVQQELNITDNKNINKFTSDKEISKACRTKGDKILAQVIVPNRQTISNYGLGDCPTRGEDGGELRFSSRQTLLSKLNADTMRRNRFDNMNGRYANISFSINYDEERELSDELKMVTATDNMVTPNEATKTQLSDSDSSGSTVNEQIIINQNKNQFFHIEKPEGFKTYKELVQIKQEDNNNDEDVDDEYQEDNDDNEYTVGNTITNEVKSRTMRMVDIEKWLHENAEIVKNDEQIAIITTMQPTRRQSQFATFNNLDILSKISEEDEEKFSGIDATTTTNSKSITKTNKLVNKDLLYGNSIKTITKVCSLTDPAVKQIKNISELPSLSFLEHKFAKT